MYHECYGEAEEAKRLYGALAENERDFERIDLSAAEAACPQGIPIRERLALAKRLLSA
jgi:predicted aldo/keto reductase-like oxidoreductase